MRLPGQVPGRAGPAPPPESPAGRSAPRTGRTCRAARTCSPARICSAPCRRRSAKDGRHKPSSVLHARGGGAESFVWDPDRSGPLATYPGLGRSRRPLVPYLVLLRMGFAVRPLLPAARCALTAPFHPCLCPLRRAPGAIGGLLSAALSVASRRPGVTRHPALRSSDFPPTGKPDGSRRRSLGPSFADPALKVACCRAGMGAAGGSGQVRRRRGQGAGGGRDSPERPSRNLTDAPSHGLGEPLRLGWEHMICFFCEIMYTSTGKPLATLNG